jgi:hypothetical protein
MYKERRRKGKEKMNGKHERSDTEVGICIL